MPILPNIKLSEVKVLPLRKRSAIFQFPNIYRFITEYGISLSYNFLYPKLLVVSFLSGFMLIAIALQSQALLGNLAQVRTYKQQRQGIINEINSWQKSLAKYQQYPDIYLQLAALEYKVGNTAAAQKYINKALAIDPNNEQGSVLGAKISR